MHVNLVILALNGSWSFQKKIPPKKDSCNLKKPIAVSTCYVTFLGFGICSLLFHFILFGSFAPLFCLRGFLAPTWVLNESAARESGKATASQAGLQRELLSPKPPHPFSIVDCFFVHSACADWNVARSESESGFCAWLPIFVFGKKPLRCVHLCIDFSLWFATTWPYVSRLIPGIFSKECLHPKTVWAEKANFNHSEWLYFFMQIKMTVNVLQGSESPLPHLPLVIYVDTGSRPVYEVDLISRMINTGS